MFGQIFLFFPLLTQNGKLLLKEGNSVDFLVIDRDHFLLAH